MSTADMVMIGLAILILAFAFWPRSTSGQFVAPAMPIQHAPQPITPSSAYSAFKQVVEADGGRKVVEAASNAHARREAEFFAEALATFSRQTSQVNPTPPPSGA